ncbi:hypothetical protein [Phaffia rhodozyma]|uniref:Uncharacterized protein n=1 Tax=Phaffia rhodozyma TaxID=264483 RepID=A0A0F7SRM7_PHARH|nr:hypothetical protein [Phaffia rhodozyma]
MNLPAVSETRLAPRLITITIHLSTLAKQLIPASTSFWVVFVPHVVLRRSLSLKKLASVSHPDVMTNMFSSGSPSSFLLSLLLILTIILQMINPTLASPTNGTSPVLIRGTNPRQVDSGPAFPTTTELAQNKPSHQDFDCRPFGECERCPASQRHEPFCQPYGNRRLLHCVPKGSLHHPNNPGGDPSTSPSSHELHENEIPAWEACGRVVSKERTDYWEFVTVNMLFFVLATTLMLLRGRKLATLQYRMLAARIGIPGTGGGSRFLGFSL